MSGMKERRIELILELAAWTAGFVWLFNRPGDAGTNLLGGSVIVLALIGVRFALAIICGAFASVARGLLGRD